MAPDLDPLENGRRAAAVSHLLGQIGLTTPEQTRWWNHVAHHELGGRTATQAWLAGDIDDVKALLRMAVVWNIPTACDRASADFMISSPLMDKEYDRLVPDYDMYRNRKVPGVETPPIPIPGVDEMKVPRGRNPADAATGRVSPDSVSASAPSTSPTTIP